MKKILLFTLGFLLLSSVVIGIEKPTPPIPKLITTTVGLVKSIDAQNQSFVIEKTGVMKFWYRFLGALKIQNYRSLNIIVTTTSETEFKKKTTEGVTDGTFTDLQVGQKVQVKGTYIKAQATTTTSSPTTSTPSTIQPEIKATSVFILTPASAVIKECQTDADCAWCGNTCVNKNTLRGKYCAQVMLPQGFDCKCHNNICQKIASSQTTATTSTTTPNILDQNCLDACTAQGRSNGICRQWAVTAKAKFGCNPNEISIGQTKDCTTIINGQPLLGIGKTCCCK